MSLDKAIEAADVAIKALPLNSGHVLPTPARAAIEAALPHLEAHFREVLAQKLEAEAERLYNNPALPWRFDEHSKRIRLACAVFLRESDR